MRYPSTTAEVLRRRRVIVAAATITLLLVAGVTYAVLLHRTSASHVAPADPSALSIASPTIASPAAGTARPDTVLPALPPTSDPEAFARQVAEAIFAWDTTSLLTRTDHIEQLVAVADPSGASTPGLVFDLDTYLPTQAAWVELARYQTRQWLAIDAVTTPGTWATAQAQAGDQLLPGTTARTIHGTRHRAGIWEGRPVASDHDVAFTIFIVCQPSYPQCRLLRLSILDKPLD
ncbi:MAG: hypothetical protein GX643_06135 [Acidimicrobiales bacterium]|nr:hypothetical protein [Acidimicrobiales bacterium]